MVVNNFQRSGLAATGALILYKILLAQMGGRDPAAEPQNNKKTIKDSYLNKDLQCLFILVLSVYPPPPLSPVFVLCCFHPPSVFVFFLGFVGFGVSLVFSILSI